MPQPFRRTIAHLDAEERRVPRAFSWTFLALVCAASVWMVTGRSTLYAVSDEGRLLAAGAAVRVQSPVIGIVKSSHVALGERVTAGQALFVLDSASETLRREEESARIEGLRHAAAILDEVIAAERALGEATVKAGETRIAGANARARMASSLHSLAREQDSAVKRLREASLMSNLDAQRYAEAFQRVRGEASLSTAERALVEADALRIRRESEVRLLSIQRELSDLRSRLAAAESVVAELDWQIARRTLRASVDGTVADVTPTPPGATVEAGQVLASVVPDAPMRWVAHFSPREGVGRIRPGQPARIRLDAFPWTAYGALSARVASVGSEPRDNRVRVELDVVREPDGCVLVHGMTGTTDVEVEEVSPLRLILRLVGQRAQGVATEPAPAPSSTGPNAAR